MAKEMAQKKGTFVTGINVDQLFGTIDMVKKNPEIAWFNFRATNQWIAGTHSQATVRNFYGAGMEDSSRCLTTTMVAHAAARGIEIRKVESRYEGDIDLHGFLGLSDAVPVGYKRIGVYFIIDADISVDQKEELVAMAQKHSPVFNSIAKPVPVSVQLDKK